MPSSTTFTGASFALLSVSQQAPAALRLNFTDEPLQASSSGANDGLNPLNYSLSGPAINRVSSVQTIGGEPQSLYLILAAPLIPGTWEISVSNVETPLAVGLNSPSALTFTASALSSIPPLSQGSINDDEETLLRKHLPMSMVGRGWDALIAGLAVGDRYRNQQALLAFDQLFKTSASGIYLDRRAADDGFTRPPDIGMGDDVFRKLAIKTTAHKQIVQVMLETLEAYYGSDSTRAHITTTTVEPWNIEDGDTLLVQINNDVVTITFRDDDFSLPTGAKAIEVAAVITRELARVGVSGYAIPFTDPTVGAAFVKIYSGALGLSGAVRIRGGKAQNELLFPTEIHNSAEGPQPTTAFTITEGTDLNGIEAGRVRFIFNSGTNPQLVRVRAGDYVNIYGPVFAAGFRGTYEVTDASPEYFEISNSLLTWPASVTLTDYNDIRFYRPKRYTILSEESYALATQADPRVLNVLLPATTAAVNRERFTGAYLHDGEALDISSATRDTTGTLTINTASNHGLAEGDWIFIDGLYPTIGGVVGLGWNDADVTTDSLPHQDSASIKLASGQVLQCGGYTVGPVSQTDARLFDPSIDTWTVAASMSIARAGHTLTMLNSGKILVVGGTASKIAELYDVEDDVWTETGSTTDSHSYHTATLLADGKVLITGGGGSAELYNPATGTWSVLMNQPTGRTNHTATLLGDNRVLITGGAGGGDTAEVYNHVNGTWMATGNMTIERESHVAIKMPTGTSSNVLIVGGVDSLANLLSSAEVFNPATMSFTAIDPMGTTRSAPGIAIRSDNKILVAGGIYTGVSVSDTADLYDPIRNRWTAVTGTFNTARSNPNTINLDDGRVLLVGGTGAQAVAHKYTGAPVNSGCLNGLFRVDSIVDPNTLTVLTPDTAIEVTCGAVGTVTPTTAITDTTPGPFIFDPSGLSPAITAVSTTLNQQLVIGNNYTSITLTDASEFPDQSGWLVFGHGTESQIAPVKYLGRISNTVILLDPSFVLPETLDIGTDVTLLWGRGAFEPAEAESVGAFYITAAAAGRIAAAKTIDSLVAAGVQVDKTVIYPSDVGLGNAGYPILDTVKISDKLQIWGGDDIDIEVEDARDGKH